MNVYCFASFPGESCQNVDQKQNPTLILECRSDGYSNPLWNTQLPQYASNPNSHPSKHIRNINSRLPNRICKPYTVNEIPSEPNIAQALAAKLLTSIFAGVIVKQLQTQLFDKQTKGLTDLASASDPCTIVRAILNLFSQIQESITGINTYTPLPRSPHASKKLFFFLFNPCTIVLVLLSEVPVPAPIDDTVATGFPRAKAQKIAAQTMYDAAGLILSGEHPALLRDKVSTLGGCRIGGLLVLEEGRVRGMVARVVRKAIVVAEQLGKGVVGVR
ncbi:hypothetical protein BELL_0018g00190 [Botrytis elliptica]|uniref:Pyrroline-5-carboxylate reductase dimerisation domain-containing protein n=1 Tax=Botrytis elliptica TaxID=278938 RepID=A0A4Z1K394_9HELO|nr:hypothetical protein BELL_0018g00190 [Botrytis elliptica]